MDAWPLIILLIIGAPIVLAIWLIVKAVRAASQIEELTHRIDKLEIEVSRLQDGRSLAPPSESAPKSAAHVYAETKVAEPPLKPATAPQPTPPPEHIATPPPIPIFQKKVKAEPVWEPIPAASTTTPPPSPFPTFAKTSEASTPPPKEKSSFEMRLGTYWLVRVGIVMVLTALAFFGNYAYHNFIGKLSAGGKVSLLYFASALLLGAGAWLQRKAEKPSMRNYAQVLFAGGLAAVYFTTYAAHHITQLRVIESPVLDGVLLLVWAAFMAWIADRRKSELLALFAVGLAYYTSVATNVGAFTLYSNSVLTLTAIVFLVRNRWAGLTIASLVCTYASYVFWRFLHGGEWRWANPDEGLWFGSYFLMSYWLMFTAAVFLSKHEKLAGQNRAGFLTLNNGAFFTLFLLTMLQMHSGGFWKFALIYGAVLLGLSLAAGRVLVTEPLTKNSYLTQGLLLITVGFISKYSGLQLALILGIESVFLLMLGTQRNNLILKIGAYLTAALSIGWGIDGLDKFDSHGLWLGSGLAGLMLFNAFWIHRQSATPKHNQLSPAPAYFSVLAVAIIFATTWFNSSQVNCPLVFCIEAVVLTASIYLLRVPEITLIGQSLLLVGHGILQFNLYDIGLPPWWNPAAIIGLTLGLAHWWQKQKVIVAGTRAPQMFQFALSLLFVLLTCSWLGRRCTDPTWLALSCLLAAAVTAYATLTRAWLLAACAQLFLLPGAWLFLRQVSHSDEPRFIALVPIAALGLLSFAAIQWFKKKTEASPQVRDPLLTLAMAYRWVALAMSLGWVMQYIPQHEQIWVLMLIGLVVFALAGWIKSEEAVLFGAVFSAAAMFLIWVRCLETDMIYLPNAIAILVLLGQQQVAQRLAPRYSLPARVHDATIVIGGLTLWLFVSRWVCRSGSGFYLTASWSALALVLFACGIALRERMYRWLGLFILAGALGRVVVFDVWKLETLYRILSFMALGIALLVLGFVYNKYQDKLRQWL